MATQVHSMVERPGMTELQAPPGGDTETQECICAIPVRELAQQAQDLWVRTNGHNAVLPWNVAMTLALFGVVVARSTAEKKHYAGFFSSTHRQCPVHDVIFWPRMGEQPEQVEQDNQPEEQG